MAGGIQPGTTATSVNSVLSEQKHKDLVARAIAARGPLWKIKKSLTIEEITGKPGEYSLLSSGESQSWHADGGFVFYDDKLVGVCENKWQKARENACERVCKYLTFLHGSQMFVSCEGPGFVLTNGGGSTGPLIDMLRYAGATVLENVASEQEYLDHLNKWLDSLVVQ